jgi:hypothetical protein
VVLNGLRVPRENIVGELNGGWALLNQALAVERNGLVIAAEAAHWLDLLVAHIRSSGLGSDPIVRQRVASLAAEVATARLLAWRMDVAHADPKAHPRLASLGNERFPAGRSVKFRAIAGHRDAGLTDCPGQRLYALLPAIRRAVAEFARDNDIEVVRFAKGERLGRKGFVALQIQEGFVTRDGKPIDKGPISKARQMAKHEAAVLAWRDSLTPKQRDTWNNPNSVFTHCPVFATDKPARTPPAAPTRKMPVEPKLEAWAQPKPATEVLQAKEARNAEDEAKALEAAERARQAQIENLGLKSEVEDLKAEVAKLKTQPPGARPAPALLEQGAARCSSSDAVLNRPYPLNNALPKKQSAYAKQPSYFHLALSARRSCGRRGRLKPLRT